MSNMPNNLAAGHPKWARISPRGTWTRWAACRGMNPELWFKEERGGSYTEARQICAHCPVRQACLDWAIETKTVHGLFGGLAPLERKRLRHRVEVNR